jgi:hypothetical protein
MPAFIAFVPGLFAGSMCFGLVVHLVTLLLSGLRRNPIDAPLPRTGRIWGRIFTVIHPVPWLEQLAHAVRRDRQHAPRIRVGKTKIN